MDARIFSVDRPNGIAERKCFRIPIEFQVSTVLSAFDLRFVLVCLISLAPLNCHAAEAGRNVDENPAQRDRIAHDIFTLTREAESDLYIGQYGDALAKSREAHRLLETEMDTKRTAAALIVLRVRGTAYLHVSKPEDALKLFEEGEPLIPSILEEAKHNRQDLAVANYQVARFYRQMTLVQVLVERPADALETINKALEAARSAGLDGLATFLGLDRLKDALAVDHRDGYEAAVRRIRDIMSSSDNLAGGWLLNPIEQDPSLLAELISKSPQTLELLTRANRILFYSRFARTFERNGDGKSAIQNYVAAIKLIEEGRIQVHDPEAIPRFFSTYVDIYDGAIAACYKESRVLKGNPVANLSQFGGTYPEIALYFSEAAHARQFSELYGPALLESFRMPGNLPKSARSREKELRRQLTEAVDPFSSYADLLAARKRSEQATKNYVEYLDSLEGQAQSAQLLFPRPGGIRQMPPSLKSTFLVEYKVTDSAVYWWVLFDQTMLGFGRSEVSKKELRESVRGFRKDIEKHNDNPSHQRALFSHLVRTPFDLIEKHAENSGQGSRRVIVVPDDLLHLIPWEALPGIQRQFLGDSFILSYAPSLTVLAQAMNTPPVSKGKKVLLIGNTQGEAAVTVLIHGTSVTFDALGRGEISKVIKVLEKKGYQADVLENGNATPDAFLNRDATPYSLIHIDTHGFAETLDPLPSLIFHPSSESPLGLLSFTEIAKLKLRARLVTLSACETGLGKDKNPLPGEGVEGLARMFMVARSKSVLASLWPANTDATSALMENFYLEMDTDAAPDEATALFRAKAALRRAGYKNPKLWAPFILIGDPGN